MSPGMAKALPVWMGCSLLERSLKDMARLGGLQVGSQHRRLRQDDYSEFRANALSQRKGEGGRGSLGVRVLLPQETDI